MRRSVSSKSSGSRDPSRDAALFRDDADARARARSPTNESESENKFCSVLFCSVLCWVLSCVAKLSAELSGKLTGKLSAELAPASLARRGVARAADCAGCLRRFSCVARPAADCARCLRCSFSRTSRYSCQSCSSTSGSEPLSSADSSPVTHALASASTSRPRAASVRPLIRGSRSQFATCTGISGIHAVFIPSTPCCAPLRAARGQSARPKRRRPSGPSGRPCAQRAPEPLAGTQPTHSRCDRSGSPGAAPRSASSA